MRLNWQVKIEYEQCGCFCRTAVLRTSACVCLFIMKTGSSFIPWKHFVKVRSISAGPHLLTPPLRVKV